MSAVSGFDEANQVRLSFFSAPQVYRLRGVLLQKVELTTSLPSCGIDLWRLQKELSEFLENEQSKAKLQASIHTFTGMCWDKCVACLVGYRDGQLELELTHPRLLVLVVFDRQVHHRSHLVTVREERGELYVLVPSLWESKEDDLDGTRC